jgi:hypothetical protein
MEKQFDIKIDERTCKFSSYSKVLENLPEFKQFKREITINSLLFEGKRIQFDVSEIIGLNTSIFGTTGEPDISHISIRRLSFKVKEMMFIIKDEFVEKLSVIIETLDNEEGKTLESLFNNGFHLSLRFKNSFYLENSEN